MYSWETLPFKVSKDKIKANPAQVGKAVYDIMSRPQGTQEVGETIDAMTQKYYDELFSIIGNAKKLYDDPFYVVILRKKESWALNVLRQWYVARQTRPRASWLREEYPNHDHDVWKVDGENVHLEWTLPTAQDSKTIIRNKHMYEGELVGWIEAFNSGRLA